MPTRLTKDDTNDRLTTLPTAMVVTPEEYDALPPNSRIELIDGVVHVMTPPTKRHQNLVDHLIWMLRRLCPEDFEVVREQEIRLEDDHRRNPDVIVARAGATGEDEFSYRPADVLLAIEVVSPGTQTADRKHKPVEYAQAGLPYYWRVESKPLEVHTYRLGDTDVYQSTGVFLPGEMVRVPGLEWASFEVAALA